jgi:twitching motility protein PilU
MASIDITPTLKFMVEKGGSDLFFSTDTAVHICIEGETLPINQQVMTTGMIKEIAYALMTPAQISAFEETLESNFALHQPDTGRFRVNVFMQRGEVAMVIRYIKTNIPSISALGLPAILKELVLRKRGLMLVVGATGAGKSTTLAAMIDHRNQTMHGHILTLEDPIEYIHMHKKSVVNQREVGIDTLSFENGLKNAMRQAADVILIGEIRDADSMRNAIAYAETGHLCLATLHANNANQALERIISFFPEEGRNALLMGLSMHLVAIFSQRLILGKVHKRVAATELLLNTPYIATLVQQHKFNEIKDVMANSNDLGMHTFDQSLYRLFSNGKIDENEAIANADSRNDLTLKMHLLTERHR